MEFNNGDACGPSSQRSTTVHIQCDYDGDFDVLSVEETETCKYSLALGLPLPCDLLHFNAHPIADSVVSPAMHAAESEPPAPVEVTSGTSAEAVVSEIKPNVEGRADAGSISPVSASVEDSALSSQVRYFHL